MARGRHLLSNITLKDRKVLNLQQKTPYSLIVNRAKNASFSEMLPEWDVLRTYFDTEPKSNIRTVLTTGLVG